MKTVTTHEAKTHLSSLLKRVEQGEEVEVRRGDHPVARLVPIEGAIKKTRPKVGTVTSPRIEYSEDAFAPLSKEEMTRWGLA
jgi:prevent-host-death family protein